MKYCINCMSTRMVENHHVFFGTGLRKISDKYECMQVNLCYRCHRASNTGVHGGNRLLDLELKAKAQSKFEAKYGHDKFMELIGRNYL